jgi:KDO2-lipid IV(A) lauroyltransferase
MAWILYLLALGLAEFLQAIPLRWAARLGRAGGALLHALDASHREVARRNLTLCLGSERSPREIRELVREHFRRLGENYGCAVKTAAMSWEDLKPFVEFVGAEKVDSSNPGQPPRTVVVAIGHFGNFELYARFGQFLPAFQCATTYRAGRQPLLNNLVQKLRERSGCVYFERRSDTAALKAWMTPTGRMLGLLADQHASSGGVRVPFFGKDCATTASPAVFALRYDCPLHTAICHRVGLGRWRIEIGDEIPTREQGRPRATEAIMRDVNRAFETAIRLDPPNWFWVHRRWKPDKPKVQSSRSPAQSPEPAPQA